MVSGRAGGGGYDREGAAVRDAIRKLAAFRLDDRPRERVNHDAFMAALASLDVPEGQRWQVALESRGFKVEVAA